MAALRVQKYGGTSLHSPEQICKVADRIALDHRAGHQVVVVVSAMGQTTDELERLAYQVSSSPPSREMDMLLTSGERVSMALLSMALFEREVGAISLTGSQTGIITTPDHRRARIQRVLGDRVREGLRTNKVVIVAGFQGVSEAKDITTLGRGGSDTTAVALSVALKASSCEIYTDVDGFYSADPRWVSSARLWKDLPYDLAIEAADKGSQVMHVRSVELAKKYGIQLQIRNSMGPMNPEGTVISDQKPMESFEVSQVTARSSRMPLFVSLARPTVLGALMDEIEGSRLELSAPFFQENQVWCFVEREAEGPWQKRLDRLVSEGFVREYQFFSSWVPVSVVGYGASDSGRILQRMMETLGRTQVKVQMGTASPLSVTVAVPDTHVKEAVQALHDEFLGK